MSCGRLWGHIQHCCENRATVTELSAGFGNGCAGSDLAAAVAEADGLTHCTPTGMAKLSELPLPAALLYPALWGTEIVNFR
jgi:shikimate dehydrogenase